MAGHPAPPLSFMGSHEAVITNSAVSKSAPHSRQLKRKRSESVPAAPQPHHALAPQQPPHASQKQCPAAAS